MKEDVNDLLLFNDLSIDREKYKKVTKSIPDTDWTVDNRGVVYNSRGNPSNVDSIWNGSLRVLVRRKGLRGWRYIDDLVLRAFIGPPPSPNHRPWHKDGDRSNNSLDNLSWQVLRGSVSSPKER